MAISKVQSASNKSNLASVASLAQAFGSNVTSGNAVFAVVHYYNAPVTVTMTDTRGGTGWTEVGTSVNQGPNVITSHIFYGKLTSGGACTVTASFGSNISYCGLAIFEYSGFTTLSLDVSGSNKGNSTAPSYTGLTTTQANTLVIVSYLSNSGGSASFTGATIQERTNFSTLFQSNIAADDINTSAGSQSYSATQSSGHWIVHAAAFYTSAGNNYDNSLTIAVTSTTTQSRELVIDKSLSMSTINSVSNSKLTDLVAACTVTSAAIQAFSTNADLLSSGQYTINSQLTTTYSLLLFYNLSAAISAAQSAIGGFSADSATTINSQQTISTDKLLDLYKVSTFGISNTIGSVVVSDLNGLNTLSSSNIIGISSLLDANSSLGLSTNALQLSAKEINLNSELLASVNSSIASSAIIGINSITTLLSNTLFSLQNNINSQSTVSLSSGVAIDQALSLVLESTNNLNTVITVIFGLGNNFSSELVLSTLANINNDLNLVVNRLWTVGVIAQMSQTNQLILEATILINSIQLLLVTLGSSFDASLSLSLNSIMSNSFENILNYSLVLANNSGLNITTTADLAANVANTVVALCQNLADLQANAQVTLGAETMLSGLGGKNYFENLLLFFTFSLSTLGESGIIDVGTQSEILKLTLELLMDDYSLVILLDEYLIQQLIDYYEVIRFGTITD